jgi:hypothetical protein
MYGHTLKVGNPTRERIVTMPKTATKAPGVVEIPALQIVRLQVKIRGLTPLIVHRFSDEVLRSIEAAQQQAAKVKKAPRDPEAEFRQSVYHTPDGGYGFPAIGVKLAMVRAGQRYADEKATELYGAFSIPQEMLEIEGSEPEMRSDRVVLGGLSRTSSIAYRAQFTEWAMDVPLIINGAFITPDQTVNLLRLAGFSVGIGDWRIEKKGTFGQFEVAEVRGL